MHQKIQQLHSLYCEYSGRQVALDVSGAGEAIWFSWIKMGFTAEDLKIVCDYLKRGILKGERNHGCLKWRNLIGDPLAFSDELAEAKAFLRNAKPAKTPRQRVLEATGRAEEPKTTIQTPQSVLKGLKAFEDFKAFARRLDG